MSKIRVAGFGPNYDKIDWGAKSLPEVQSEPGQDTYRIDMRTLDPKCTESILAILNQAEEYIPDSVLHQEQ